jgi:hypothetical protein
MNKKRRDRLVDLALIVVFLGTIAGCAYLIIKMMTRWKVPGLG